MLLDEPSYEYEPAAPAHESHEPMQHTEPVFQLDPRVVTLQSDTEPLEEKKEAFTSIVEEHEACLYHYASKIVGPFEAEDIVQDAFLRAWNKVGTLQPTYARALPKWLYRITHNLSLNQKRNYLFAQASEGPRPLSPIGDPVAAQEFREDIASLNQLAETQKQALMLRVIMGLSHEEIAQRQNVSRIAAKARLQRGRAHARSILRPVDLERADEAETDDEHPKAA